MAELNARETEALDTYRRYLAQRALCESGDAPWSSIGAFFTDDAVFIDPAWGRAEGAAEIGRLMEHAMSGLEDWSFPEEWTTVDGDRVVTFWWNRLPGTGPDGSPYQAPAFSVLHYAGDGLFDYELDLVNMAEVGELLVDSGWTPGPGMNVPGPHPDRNVTPRRLGSP
jgi:ketosteroid isomerase-like protein